jgi:PEP-CTERM motif
MKMRQWLGAMLLLLSLGTTGNAAVIVNINQVGADVVATGSGTLDLSALSAAYTGGGGSPSIAPAWGFVVLGDTPWRHADIWANVNGPSTFGTGFGSAADQGTGDGIGVSGDNGWIYVPPGYISGNSLSASDVWLNSSFKVLGLTEGTYKYEWGSGNTYDYFTVNINGSPAVPEPSTFLLLGAGLGGLAFIRRKARK